MSEIGREIEKCKTSLQDPSSEGLATEALAKLIELKHYDAETAKLVEKYKESEAEAAFHYPLSELARVYLHLAGAEKYCGDDETTLGLIEEYGK